MKILKLSTLLVIASVFFVTACSQQDNETASVVQTGTLEDVKARGYVKCGVTTGLLGFAAPDDSGKWSGFDVDVCRAVAAAVLGDSSKVEFTTTTGKTRFPTLASGEIDVLARNTTWTFSRDVNLGFEFVGVNYYDGQGFLVPSSLGVTSATQLDGASVCIQTGTTTELNLADFFRINNISYEAIPVETNDESRENLFAGRCDVYTTDASGLAATAAQADNPAYWILLPEIISKEPLGPLVRHGDHVWGDIVRWSLNTMVIAEEKGLTSANVDSMVNSTNDPEVLRLTGNEGEYGVMFGLPNNFGYNIIKQVGNYGEVFERNIGSDTPLKLARGLNAPWTDGGILYSPPFR
jgi:general L-amino acid transport system substrate-binding protein